MILMKEIKIEIEISERVFCFYALLNASGYNPEKEVHPIREKIRSLLKPFSSQTINNPELQKEYWFPLRTWVLCHDQPPLFQERHNQWKKFLEEETTKKFKQEMILFWEEQGSSLWNEVKDDYSKLSQDCLQTSQQAVDNALEYLKIDPGIDKFIVIPNFLEEKYRGIGPRIDRTAYALMGYPLSLPRIQHEFLHSVINPLINENREEMVVAIARRLNKKEEHPLLLEYEKQDKDFKTFLLNKTAHS